MKFSDLLWNIVFYVTIIGNTLVDFLKAARGAFSG